MRPIDPCHRRDRRATTAAILFLACGGAAILFFSDNDRLQTLQSRSLAEDSSADAIANGRHLKNKGHTIVATVQEISMPTPPPTPEVAKRLPGPYLKLRYTGGRIGNDLFSLASGYGIAAKYGYNFCINTLSLDVIDKLPHAPSGFSIHRIERYFKGPFTFCDKHWKVKSKPIRAGHHINNFDQRDLSKYDGDDLEVSDFMQSYGNFRHVKDEVLAILTFNEEYVKKAAAVLEPFRRDGDIIVGIHARRGDKIDCSYCDAPGDDYYVKAIERMREELGSLVSSGSPRIKFLLASEGSEGYRWFNDHKREGGMFASDEFQYIGSSDPMLDLAVLSSCDHIVASGGTFSWWAAFLGPTQKGGIVIHSNRLWSASYGNPTEWIPIDDSSRATLLKIK